MTNLIKGFLVTLGGKRQKKGNDFSDFFSKPAADKARVIRHAMREANEEQLKMVKEYREQLSAS